MLTLLKEAYLMPGETLLRPGDICRELYFVQEGIVQICDVKTVQKEIRGDVADMSCTVAELSFFAGPLCPASLPQGCILNDLPRTCPTNLFVNQWLR